MDQIDKQTLYKEQSVYYELHKQQLLKKGYIITKENRYYTVFVLRGIGERTTHQS